MFDGIHEGVGLGCHGVEGLKDDGNEDPLRPLLSPLDHAEGAPLLQPALGQRQHIFVG